MSQSSPKKLRIPAPHEEPHESFGVVELSLLASAIFAVSVIGWFISRPAPQKHVQPAVTQDGHVVERLSASLKAEKSRADKLDALPSSELTKRTWTDEEVVAVVRFGKRETAEAACDARAKQIEADTVADAMRLELVKALDRRSESAPYACLSRLYFEDKLPQKDLVAELDEFWGDAYTWQGNTRLVSEIVDRYRITRNRPQSRGFERWLRLCGLNFDYGAVSSCQQLLNQLSPAQGTDLVMTVIKELEVSTPSTDEHKLLAKALGRLARNGQPPAFRTLQTKELPDYDVDFRYAAVLMLCRYVNSPDEDVAFAAAEELSQTTHFSARSYDRNVLVRWREGCRVAFGGTEDQVSLPLLAVWSGDENDPPDYKWSTEVELGECVLQEGYPDWYCGAKLFIGKGPLDKTLDDIFVKTAWVEWVDQ